MKTLLVVLCLVLPAALTQAQEPGQLPVLTVYSYHQAPPFHVDALKNIGLNFDFVKALQQQLKDIVRLEHQTIARPELNKRLKRGEPAIVLWGSPLWFQFLEQEFLWSKPIFNDEDVVASLVKSNFSGDWQGFIKGKKLGGRSGYRYATIDDMVARGEVQRIDAPNDLVNIERLLVGQVDAILIVKSSLLYYVRTMDLINTIKLAGKAHSSYDRQILVTEHYRDYLPRINQAIDKIMSGQELKQRFILYGVKDL